VHWRVALQALLCHNRQGATGSCWQGAAVQLQAFAPVAWQACASSPSASNVKHLLFPRLLAAILNRDRRAKPNRHLQCNGCRRTASVAVCRVCSAQSGCNCARVRENGCIRAGASCFWGLGHSIHAILCEACLYGGGHQLPSMRVSAASGIHDFVKLFTMLLSQAGTLPVMIPACYAKVQKLAVLLTKPGPSAQPLRKM
jgi:hypothetical protein